MITRPGSTLLVIELATLALEPDGALLPGPNKLLPLPLLPLPFDPLPKLNEQPFALQVVWTPPALPEGWSGPNSRFAVSGEDLLVEVQMKWLATAPMASAASTTMAPRNGRIRDPGLEVMERS
jgi:hypothetical protein